MQTRMRVLLTIENNATSSHHHQPFSLRLVPAIAITAYAVFAFLYDILTILFLYCYVDMANSFSQQL